MLKKMFQNRFINILILGLASGFSMPPFCIWPILFFGLSYLFVCVMREDKIIKKFLIGYLFGFSFSIGSLEWIAHSAFAFCNPDLYIFYPILLLVIPFCLAFFIAVPSAITIILKKFTPIKMGIGFAVLISIFEWIRSFYGLQPFCWNLFSHAFATSIYTLQITSIIGILGLSLFSIILLPYYYTYHCPHIHLLLIPNILHLAFLYWDLFYHHECPLECLSLALLPFLYRDLMVLISAFIYGKDQSDRGGNANYKGSKHRIIMYYR